MRKIILRMLALSMTLISLQSYAIEETRFLGKKFDVPTREVALIVSDVGYFPNQLVVFKGEKVRFYITSTTDRPTCLMLKGKDLFVPAKKGVVSEADIYFDREENLELYCPSNNFKGKVSVFEHPDERRRREAREIASEKKVKVWIPRDE
ncbi:hypothetical protein M899_1987 [Bacteriovorax sp. BSW11_IV]|uniref:hypothetical protein n=1 Tax=Bacteriovorax sp. BSW11_IV TaxID=1353529 RepID=UPI00038A3B71|nr:hypothetical protein [Bacteriovorax sp. BSW11_IV]EQC46397.1 hypothetical protein M899_1987 [Bacteriovorax sp. BSW11_IV]